MVLWATRLVPAVSTWQRNVFGQPFLTIAGCFIGLPLLLLLLTHRNVGEYGITFRQLTRSLEIGLTALSVLGPASGIAFPLLLILRLSPSSWQGGIVLALIYGASLPLVAYVVRNTRPVDEQLASRRSIAGFVLVLGAALALAALTLPYTRIVASVLYALLFVGFGEELLFRGCLQSRLNQALGRPYHMLGVACGWGLVGAALLFGLAHVLSPLNPLQLGWGLWTFVLGLVFGYLREKSGSFVASAIVHGTIIAVPVLLFGSIA
jgi:membrane protease YdiL (CAAX protease family)